MFSRSWNRIPASVRAAVPFLLVVSGVIALLVWSAAWWLCLAGLLLALLDLAIGKHDNSRDKERRGNRKRQQSGSMDR